MTAFWSSFCSKITLAWQFLWQRLREWVLKPLLSPFLLHRSRWYFRINGEPARERLDPGRVGRYLARCEKLGDPETLERFAQGGLGSEPDFYPSRETVLELMRRILSAWPPFLDLGQPFPEESSAPPPVRYEVIKKRKKVLVTEAEVLLVPQTQREVHRKEVPPGNQSLRPARSLGELRRARLLDQVLPLPLQVERLTRGELMVVDYVDLRCWTEFVPQERLITREEERETEVWVELDNPEVQNRYFLLYILLDRSASMRGRGATLALSALAATLRAQMDFPAVYYLRTFAETVDPPSWEPPRRASTLQEREALFEWCFTINFNGYNTRTASALEVAVRDMTLAQGKDPSLEKAYILLITDGRSVIWEHTQRLIQDLKIPLHTVLVSREKARDLERISSSFTVLDGFPGL